jgi:TRAP-type mannitol/chloroaromatic compound transport system permease small subunit
MALLQQLESFARLVDRINEWVGRGTAWLTLAMVAICFVVVVLRYAFGMGWVWMQEAYVWLHGVVFMAGAGYTLLHGGHVRVDIFYREASARRRALVDLVGALLLLLPVVVLIAVVSFPYVAESWARLETSREAGGLHGLFLLKTVLLVFCALLGLQGLSLAARSVLALARPGEAAPAEEPGKVL